MRWPIRGQSSHLQLKLKWNADIESCNRAYWLFTESFNLYNTCTIPFQTCQCALPPPPLSARHPFTIKRRRGDFQDKRRKNKKGISRYSHNATVKQQFWLPLYFGVTWNSNLRVVLFFFFFFFLADRIKIEQNAEPSFSTSFIQELFEN